MADTQLATFDQLMRQKEDELARLLVGDKYLTAERMLALASTIASGSFGNLRKALVEMPFTVVNCFVQAAALGLEPNTKLNHAALVPFKTKSNKYACQLIIQYQGYVHLAVSCGAADDFRGMIVFQSEIEAGNFYEQPTSRADPIVHKIDPREKRPSVNTLPDVEKYKVAGAYALAFLPSGVVKAKYMTVEEIEYIRKTYSKAADAESGYSPWEKRWSEMALKSPLRNLIKTMRLTGEAKLTRAIELDETQWHIRHEEQAEVPDDPPTPTPKTVEVVKDVDSAGRAESSHAGSEHVSKEAGSVPPSSQAATSRSGGAETDPLIGDEGKTQIEMFCNEHKIKLGVQAQALYDYAKLEDFRELRATQLPGFLEHLEKFC